MEAIVITRGLLLDRRRNVSGRLEVFPGSVTTVPGHVTLWVDVRDIDAEVQRDTAAAVLAEAQAIADERRVLLDVTVASHLSPVVLDAWPRALAQDECQRLDLPFRVMASGAGHDAALVARRAPATMVFVPCADGISHAPQERATAADIAAGALVISGALRRGDALFGGRRR